MKKHLKNIFISYTVIVMLGLFILSLLDCSTTRPHDHIVIENLLKLKNKVMSFYDTFQNDKIDETKIAEINNDFDNLISEEEKKKDKSPEYIKQLTISKQMFNRHCEDKKKSKLSETMIGYYKQNISDALDAMSSTENLRRKQDKEKQ